MWKLLIADDEPKIRQGLRNALNWGELDIEITGEAEDGEMALTLAATNQPDMILLDICMPFLNGLQFIEKLRQAVTDCTIIIITGHDEFSYAQQAVKLHVFDYLLKPVSTQQLCDVIHRAKAAVAVKAENKSLQFTNRQMEKNLPLLQEKFLVDWIHGHLIFDEIKEQIKFFDLPLTCELELIVIKLVEKFNKGKMIEDWDKELLLFAVENIALDFCRKYCVSHIVVKEKAEQVIVLADLAAKDCMEFNSSIEQTIERSLKHIVLIERKSVKQPIFELANAYDEIKQAMRKQECFTPIVVLAQKYIDKYYYHEELSLQDVAEEMQISSTYLSRLLKQEIGVSFVEYLTQVRVKKAIQFMKDPHMRMYEIAERVGYSSQHYFSTAFKKVVGSSPMEYRKGKM